MSLRFGGSAGLGVVERPDEILVADAHLDREGALPGGGGPAVEVEELGDDLGATKTPEARRSEHHGIQIALRHPREPGVDIAADVDDLEVGAPATQLSSAARRAGADPRPSGVC